MIPDWDSHALITGASAMGPSLLTVLCYQTPQLPELSMLARKAVRSMQVPASESRDPAQEADLLW